MKFLTKKVRLLHESQSQSAIDYQNCITIRGSFLSLCASGSIRAISGVFRIQNYSLLLKGFASKNNRTRASLLDPDPFFLQFFS
jgi:hypothetical protein